ncbi:uncharacterized protein ACIB01_019328 [Guaruba guarouba]
MELRGHILTPNPAGPGAGRLQELRERQRGLRQALGLRLRELRRLCLQEAELTGKLPPEYPLEPGELPQAPPSAADPPPGPPPCCVPVPILLCPLSHTALFHCYPYPCHCYGPYLALSASLFSGVPVSWCPRPSPYPILTLSHAVPVLWCLCCGVPCPVLCPHCRLCLHPTPIPVPWHPCSYPRPCAHPLLSPSLFLSHGISVPIPVLVPILCCPHPCSCPTGSLFLSPSLCPSSAVPILAAAPQAPRSARREVALQLQVVEAARRLAAAPGLAPEQRRRRQRLQAEATQRLRQLRAQLGPGNDENGSLYDLPVLENGALPTPKPTPVAPSHPSPPRASPGSPERRPHWAPDGRRSSLASPASPARTLPRSASSFEGRSVPATPVLARSPCARGHPLCRPEAPGLPPRPWSGSQDSQLGGPPAPPPPAQAPRTRRSNSSEALIDWGGSGGGSPHPDSAAPPQPAPPTSAEQRRSQKWLALEGLRDWYLRHTGTPPPPAAPPRPRMGAPPPQRPPPSRPSPLAQLRRGPGAQGLRGPPPCAHPPTTTPGPTAPRHPGVTPSPLTRSMTPPNPGPPPGRSWRAAALGGPPSHAPPLHGSGVWLGWGGTEGFNTRDLLPFIVLPGSFLGGGSPCLCGPIWIPSFPMSRG